MFVVAGREPAAVLRVQTNVGTAVNRSARDTLDDAELVRRAQRADGAAFAALVARYQERVFNVCSRMCRHQADALDLAQAAFVRAFEALPRFEARANFFTWLFRIVVNLALSQRRRGAVRREVSLEALDGEADRLRPSPERRWHDPARDVENRELGERLEAALASLDEEFRIAVVLKDIEELDYATIAEILDVPVGTVKSRIHRGRMLLREQLAAEGLLHGLV